jgi:hypothetical protein
MESICIGYSFVVVFIMEVKHGKENKDNSGQGEPNSRTDKKVGP